METSNELVPSLLSVSKKRTVSYLNSFLIYNL